MQLVRLYPKTPWSQVKHSTTALDPTLKLLYRNILLSEKTLTWFHFIFSELEVRYPKFFGNSFLALPVLKTGYKHLDILLEFKPTAKYGLLFFSAEFEDARSDFFSVALIDGFIEFR